MVLIVVIGLLFLTGILSGVYQSLRHILGYKFAFMHSHGSNITVFILRIAFFLFFSWFTISGFLLTLGLGLMFALLNVFFPKWSKRLQRLPKGAKRAILTGTLCGALVSGIFAIVVAILTGEMLTFSSAGMLGPISLIGGGLVGGLANSLILSLQFMGSQISLVSYKFIAPLFIAPRFATIVCNHCYRYTRPQKSRYMLGLRYCEHCREQVVDTKEPGKVVCIFGEYSFTSEGRTFVLSNPDFEQKTHHIELSEVYIDPKTADRRLFERFITYIVNYPPNHGIQSVKVFYRNELETLGKNIQNALHNTFEHVTRVA